MFYRIKLKGVVLLALNKIDWLLDYWRSKSKFPQLVSSLYVTVFTMTGYTWKVGQMNLLLKSKLIEILPEKMTGSGYIFIS